MARIKEILDTLELADGSQDDLRTRLTRFSSLCDRLDVLTRDHDICQDVDTSLSAVPPGGVTSPGSVFRWQEVLAGLRRISDHRPGDVMAGRMVGYAVALDKAVTPRAASDNFTLLRGQFATLFRLTDEELHDVTRELVEQATRLSGNLAEYA